MKVLFKKIKECTQNHTHKELLDFHHKIHNLEIELNSAPEVCRPKRYVATAIRRLGELTQLLTINIIVITVFMLISLARFHKRECESHTESDSFK